VEFVLVVEGQDWRFRRKHYSQLFSLKSLRELMLPRFHFIGEKVVEKLENAKGFCFVLVLFSSRILSSICSNGRSVSRKTGASFCCH
jgi:hypothetical protein